ncbi:MAG TPA: PP2C family protein-serine/threonine phosphatase [Roseiflexaceae bacterium]|nr:PP2C family protein-serine/threonine phosphatase [Roseiflexaceae bacterium]
MGPDQRLVRIVDALGRGRGALEETEREHLAREVVGIAYGTILALIGLGWLTLATDVAQLRAVWPHLLLLTALAVLLNRLDFFWIVERRSGAYERWSAPLGGLVTTSAAFLFGPTGIWLGVIVAAATAARDWRAAAVTVQRWNVIRTLVLNLSGTSLGLLLGLALYERLGGRFPLPGLAAPDGPLAALAVLTLAAVDWLCWSCYLLIARWMPLSRTGAQELGLFALFEGVAYLPELFGVLAAAAFVQMGVAAYLVLIAGALLVSVLAQRLSRAVERSEQRSRELAQLEQLGRALITAPPEVSSLPGVLTSFVPSMLRAEQVEIRLVSGEVLYAAPTSRPPAAEAVWAWLQEAARPCAVAVGETPPWGARPTLHALAAAPIIGIEPALVLGGIWVRFSPAVDDPGAALPALQSLAAQIASALYRAAEHSRAVAHQRMVQELAMAAEIQASFLPGALPAIAGWQLAATLRPARQTSGDFYDVLELPHGRLGLIIADVADKGTGAALYMALSRTLIRTYAFEYPDQPERALQAANTRILRDSRNSLFVTVFYGVLDLASGVLVYCNAGHNPPYLVRGGAAPRPLRNTGIPLGVEPDATWSAGTVQLQHGDTLVLYTDGVTEAQDAGGELFEVGRLLAAVQGCAPPVAQAIQEAILAAVERFAGAAPQADDLTLLVLVRE